MPRNGSGVYSKAAGSTAQTLTTISSTAYNATIDDLVDDANAARPIVAGGTGATTAAGARTNLGLETTYLKRIEAEGTIASASTCDIGAEPEYRLNVTGTTTITSFGTTANSRKLLRFSDAVTLTYNATTLILPGAADITTAAGDIFKFASDGSGNWRCVGYTKADGKALVNSAAVGKIDIFPGSSPPDGFLECDGSAISRTDYADLFSVIGTSAGAGDGSTTFNIPDLRGEFVRGWDNGRGVDSSRALLSSQGFAMEDHAHTMGTPNGAAGSNRTVGQSGSPSSYGAGSDVRYTSTLSGSSYSVADETRPRNVAMMFIIKY